MSKQQPKIVGELVVVALKARNLQNHELIGKADPFATFRIASNAKRTRTDKKGGQHPEWDDEVRFQLTDESSNRKMKVQVYDEDKREHDLLGETVVELDEVLKKGESDDWYELKFNNRDAGEIYLEMTFYSASKPPPKPPAQKPLPEAPAKLGHQQPPTTYPPANNPPYPPNPAQSPAPSHSSSIYNTYPPQNNAYPPQNNAYPPQNNAYPPPQNNAYPPPNNTYPPPNNVYPPPSNAYPPPNNAYPPQYPPVASPQQQPQSFYPPGTPNRPPPPQTGHYPSGYPALVSSPTPIQANVTPINSPPPNGGGTVSFPTPVMPNAYPQGAPGYPPPQQQSGYPIYPPPSQGYPPNNGYPPQQYPPSNFGQGYPPNQRPHS